MPYHAPFMGTLDAGETAAIRVHSCSGIQYRVYGLCDGECGDLDLTACDISAEILVSDVLPDDVPILSFTPAESGITTLSVDMVSCTGSCDWAVQVFIDDAITPATPSPGDGGASSGPSDRDDVYLGTYRGPAGDTTILRQENRLVVLLPLSQRRNGAIGVLRPTGATRVFRLENDGSGSDGEQVRLGRYTDGEKNGHWVERFANGTLAKGPYMAGGKPHGHWILTFSNGQAEEGPYVDGERQGRWVVRSADGDTFYVTFVRGVPQER